MKNNIGEYIKAERLRYKNGNNIGISQIDLSLKIGWENPSTLSRIEQGKIIPTKETVINIFEALEIPQEVVVCIFIKSNYLYTGEILTEKYIEKVTKLSPDKRIFSNSELISSPKNTFLPILLICNTESFG